jgi:hypothetical protein
MDRAEEMEIEGKEVVLGHNPCPLCTDNAAVGVIGLKEEFPSGHIRTPFHPNCCCALAPARLPEKPEEIVKAGEIREIERDFTDRYKDAETEKQIGLRSDGTPIAIKTGTKTEVSYTARELQELRDNKVYRLVHNHPNGSSFSPDDILFAQKTRAREMVVVSKKYRYTISPEGKNWGDLSELTMEYNFRHDRVIHETINEYRRTGDAKGIWMRESDKIWRELAPKYNLVYRRSKI